MTNPVETASGIRLEWSQVRYTATLPAKDGKRRTLSVLEGGQAEKGALLPRTRIVTLLLEVHDPEPSAEGEIERAFTITGGSDGHFRATDQGSEAFFWNGPSEGLQPKMGLQQLFDSIKSPEHGNVPLLAASKAIGAIRQILREWATEPFDADAPSTTQQGA